MEQLDPEKLTLIGALLIAINALVLAIVGALRGWWVPGYQYRERCVERDRQTLIAERLVTDNGRLIGVIEDFERLAPRRRV